MDELKELIMSLGSLQVLVVAINACVGFMTLYCLKYIVKMENNLKEITHGRN